MSTGRLEALSPVRGWMVWMMGLRPAMPPAAVVSSTGPGMRLSLGVLARVADTLLNSGAEGAFGCAGLNGEDPCADGPRYVELPADPVEDGRGAE